MLTIKKAQTPWQSRHNDAVQYPRNGFERLAQALECWEEYANTHRARYGTPLGDDYVLGPAWLDQGKAFRTLLNGETGRLDCGTLDAFVLNTLAANGFDTAEL